MLGIRYTPKAKEKPVVNEKVGIKTKSYNIQNNKILID